MTSVSLRPAAIAAFALSALVGVPRFAPAQFGGLIKKKIATVATGQAQAVKPAGENVAFDNITLELTTDRLDKLIVGKQAGRKLAEGPSGVNGLREKKGALDEQLRQLRDKNGKVFDAWDTRKSAISSCRDSVLSARQEKIAESFQMNAMNNPELLQKMSELGMATQKAMAKGDTALARKLTLQTAAMMEPTRTDSLAADRKCGSTKDAPAVVAQATSLQEQIDQLENHQLAPGRDHPQRHGGGDLGAPAFRRPQPCDDLVLEGDHHFQGDLEQDRGQQREGEAFADDRWDVLDGQVEDDHVDEQVDDVGPPDPDRPADWTSWRTRLGGDRPSRLRCHSAILT